MPRIDVFLTEKEIYKSRERAKRALEMGLVKVNGNVITKPSFVVSEDDSIEASDDPVPFVSRGALKIAGAFDVYDIDVKNSLCVDVGASTGGFTEFLLQRGAKKVLAVDVGHGQLDEKLARDSRVINLEGTDIRSDELSEFYETADFAATDVSFISLRLVIPSVYKMLKENGLAVFLVKPQFEVGRKALDKRGVVKDKKLLAKVMPEMKKFAESIGFEILKECESPITGGDGNLEFLLIAKKYIKKYNY